MTEQEQLARVRIATLSRELSALRGVVEGVIGQLETEITICRHVGVKGTAAALESNLKRLREALTKTNGGV